MPEGIGYGGQPPTSAPQVPSQQEAASNQQKWYDKLTSALQDPVQAMSLFQIGSALAAGPSYGQSAASHIINSVGQGLQLQGRVAATQRERQEREREATMKEREHEQRVSEAQARQSATEEEAAQARELLPYKKKKMEAEANYFSRRAAHEGRGGVEGQRVAKLAQSLYNTQRDKYPTLDDAYVAANELVESNMTRPKFIADFVMRNGVLFKTRQEAIDAANEFADAMGLGVARSPAAAPPPAAPTQAQTQAPAPQSTPGALANNAAFWQQVAANPKALADAKQRWGEATVNSLIIRHTKTSPTQEPVIAP